MIEVEMDMKIVSVANMRLHWAAKARLVKSQRQKTRNALAAVAQSFGVEVLPVTVVLTRIAPRQLFTVVHICLCINQTVILKHSKFCG